MGQTVYQVLLHLRSVIILHYNIVHNITAYECYTEGKNTISLYGSYAATIRISLFK